MLKIILIILNNENQSDSNFEIQINLMDYIYIYKLIKENKLEFTHILEGVKLLETMLIIMEQHTGIDREQIKHKIKETYDVDIEVEVKSLLMHSLDYIYEI